MTRRFPLLSVDAVCARHLESARRQAEKYGIRARTVEEVLSDVTIELVVNLTPVPAHVEVIGRALEAGKHVFTEKVLAETPEQAEALRRLAREQNRCLGVAPETFLGAAVQTARRVIDSGALGEINSFAISANRDNNVLLSLFRFLRMPGGGVVKDYGVYYLTALVSLLGPVERVSALVRTPYPTHVNRMEASPEFGQVMDTPNESEVAAILRLRSGVSGTFHLNSDSILQDQASFLIYGTEGILSLPCPNGFGGEVALLRGDPDYWQPARRVVLSGGSGFTDDARGIGPAELALALREDRPCRTDCALGCHVLEVLDGMLRSGETVEAVEIASTCDRPAALTPEEAAALIRPL